MKKKVLFSMVAALVVLSYTGGAFAEQVAVIRPIEDDWTGTAEKKGVFPAYYKIPGDIWLGIGDFPPEWDRGYAKFATSSIPAYADIREILLTATTIDVSPLARFYVTSLTVDPETASAQDLWEAIGDGDNLTDDWLDWLRELGTHTTSLNQVAENDLEYHLCQEDGWWAVGFITQNEILPFGALAGYGHDEPYCIVTYEYPVTIDVEVLTPVVQKPGTFKVKLTGTNNASCAVDCDLFTRIRLPDDRWYPFGGGWLFGPYTITIPANSSLTGTLIDSVPAVAPVGEYTYEANVGLDLDIWDTDTGVFYVE